MGAPFTSTPDPSDGEGSVEYQESRYSASADDFFGSADDAIPFALNSYENSPLEYDVVRVVSVNVDQSIGPDKELTSELETVLILVQYYMCENLFKNELDLAICLLSFFAFFLVFLEDYF